MTVADIDWVLVPGVALLAACVLFAPLGAQVLQRGVVFIDLAVAQVAAFAALVVANLFHDLSPWWAGACAAVAALAGAALVWWLARRWPAQREALIGLVYVAGAGLSVIAAGFDPHGRERLTALLAADVLWAGQAGAATVGVCAAVVAVLSRRALLRRDAVFYPVFAVALSAAVPVLGLYLVFALLIAPALWAQRGLPVWATVLLALVACAAGLGLSWAWDLPSGAAVAVALCGLGLAATVAAPAGRHRELQPGR